MNSAVMLRELSALTEDEHRQLEMLPDVGPFMIAPALAVWSKVYGWKEQAYSHGRSHLPLFVRQSPLGRFAYALPFGMYGFRLTDSSRADLDAILAAIRTQRFAQVNIVITGESADGLTFQGFDIKPLTAHCIDLTGDPPYSENTVRNVRKADFGRLEFRLLDKSHVHAAMSLLTDHCERTGEKRRIMRGAYRYLLSRASELIPGVVVGGAFDDGTLIAAQVFFVSAADAFYFDGFASDRGLTAGASFLIMDRLIHWLRERNILRLNLGATPSGDDGLARFKAGWGAREFCYHELVAAAPWKRLLDSFRGR